jgi:hypothetical protein
MNSKKNMARNKLQVRACLQLFVWTQDMIASLHQAREARGLEMQLQSLISTFDRLEISPAVQLLLSNMAGGFDEKDNYPPIRFDSLFYSPALIEPLTHDNGTHFELPYSIDRNQVKDIEHQESSPDRVKQIVLKTDSNQPNDSTELFIDLFSEAKFIHSQESPAYVNISVFENGLITNKPLIKDHVQALPDPTSFYLNTTLLFKYQLQLEPLKNGQKWMQKLEPGKRYRVLVHVMNESAEWISEQSSFSIKIPKQE